MFFTCASSQSSAIEEIVRLAPSDADAGFGGEFGTSVAISGDWIVVGAPLDDQRAHDAGAAYVYRRDGVHWIQHDKLMGLRLEDAKFGYSVAIDGDWIVIGSPDLYFEPMSAGPGRADVFARDDRGTPDDLSDDLWDPASQRRWQELIGDYDGAITTFSGEVAGLSFVGPVGPPRGIGVREYSITHTDVYSAGAFVDFVGATLSSNLTLRDDDGTALQGDLLPLQPPELTLFEYRSFLIVDPSELIPITLRGQVTSLVSEPSTLVLLALATAAVWQRPWCWLPEKCVTNLW